MSDDHTTQGGLYIDGTRITDSDADYRKVVKYLTVPAERQQDAAFGTDDNAAIRKLEDGALRQIADAMMAAKSRYAFDTLDDAGGDFMFRVIAVETMNRFNTGVMDADYYSGPEKMTPEIGSTKILLGTDPSWQIGPSWAPMQDQDPGTGGLKNPHNWAAQFVARENKVGQEPVAPDQMLPFRGECAGAFQLALNVGLRNVLGAGKYAEKNTFDTIKVGYWPGSNTTDHMVKAPLDEPFVYGDYIYIKNDPRYPTLAPYGSWQGLNCYYAGVDALGHGRFSGLGVSWQTEGEIATLMKNAFLGDCGQKPDTKKIGITLRYRTTLAKAPAQTGVDTPRKAAPPAPGKATGLTAQQLKTAGFAESEDGVFERAGVALDELASSLDISPHHLVQTISAPVENPTFMAHADGTPVIVNYHHADAGRFDPDAVVTASTALR